MKPISISLTNWTSFEDVTLEFPEGVFLINGPTGAGKSSLIDAVIYALYGAVPRIGKGGGLGALIRQGHESASVSFVFEVDGDKWRASRTLRVGRQTVLLEREQIADMAVGWVGLTEKVREFEALITEAIGLSYDTFVRAAMLPQGRYADLLTGDPAVRRQVLGEILALDHLLRLGTIARKRGGVAETKREALAAAAAKLEGDLKDRGELVIQQAIYEATVAVGEEELELARSWQETIAASKREVDAMRTDWVRPAVDDADEYLEATAELRANIELATEAVTDTEKESREAEAVRVESLNARPPEPDGDLLTTLVAYEQNGVEWKEEQKLLVDARELRDKAKAEMDTIGPLVQRETVGQAAYEVQQLLGSEESVPCPVCGDIYDPDRAPTIDAGDYSENKEALEMVTTTHSRMEMMVDTVGAEFDRTDQAGAAFYEKLNADFFLDLTDKQEDFVVAEAITVQRNMGEAYDTWVTADRKATSSAGAAATRYQAARDTLTRGEAMLADRPSPALDAAAVAAISKMGVDVPGPTDAPALRLTGAKAIAQKAKAVSGLHDLMANAVETVCDRFDKEHERYSIDSFDRAITQRDRDVKDASAYLIRIEEQIKAHDAAKVQVDEMAAQVTTFTNEAQVYDDLGKDLRGDRFISFVHAETLDAVVAAAGDLLGKLTGERYGLHLVGDEAIEVRDDWNGGALRPVETLSGGETFLASLALAIATSEETLKRSSTGKLECLFVDEGFGSLDPEALKMVGDGIANLQLSRTVGIITHVQALTEVVDQVITVTPGDRGATLSVT